MWWQQVLKFESSASSQDDNLFAGPRTQLTVKMSVKLPSDDWLCWKMEKVNLTLIEGYPTCPSDTSGLYMNPVYQGSSYSEVV